MVRCQVQSFLLRCLAFGPSFKCKLCASKDRLKLDVHPKLTLVKFLRIVIDRSNCCGNNLGFLFLQFLPCKYAQRLRWHIFFQTGTMTKNEMGGCGWWPIKSCSQIWVWRLSKVAWFMVSCSFGLFQAQSLLQTESQAGVNSWQHRFGLSSVLNLWDLYAEFWMYTI